MSNFSIKSVDMESPKLMCPYSASELAEALVYFTTALDEAVDAVFLASQDPKFLTQDIAEDFVLLQQMARIIGESAALQMVHESGGDAA